MRECKLRNTYKESKLWRGARFGWSPLDRILESWKPEHTRREAPGWVAALRVGGSHDASAPGCGAAPARLTLRSRVRRRDRTRSAPSEVWWQGSAGALQGTWHPCHQAPGVAAPPPAYGTPPHSGWRAQSTRGTEHETMRPIYDM